MKITYANKKVERCFTDYGYMQRKIQFEWVRAIKKHMNNLISSENFGIFLLLGLGKPEQLKGYEGVIYAIHITPNVRLIVELKCSNDSISSCEELEVKGVNDYHGGKENWYIS